MPRLSRASRDAALDSLSERACARRAALLLSCLALLAGLCGVALGLAEHPGAVDVQKLSAAVGLITASAAVWAHRASAR
jgi:hypothetical protein